MTTGVDTRLDGVARAAKNRIESDLVGSSRQFVDYCLSLVDWVVFGETKPAGTPTTAVQIAVQDAVNAGLKHVYGDEKSPEIDSGITTRRDVL